jgi:hypothetical protein
MHGNQGAFGEGEGNEKKLTAVENDEADARNIRENLHTMKRMI